MNKNNAKKEEENSLLNNFLNTKVGNNWCLKKKVVEKVGNETPDFLLRTFDNKTLGLEITEFYVKHDHLNFSRVLTRIGNKICQEIKKKYNIPISMVIDKFDPRIWDSDHKEHLDAAYNPGFSKVPSQNLFMEELRKLASDNINDIKLGKLIKQWIQIEDEYYQISIIDFPSISSGKYDCHVNNTGMLKFNPCDELQLCINKKNQKIKQYQAKCDECYLLVTVPSNKIGNYCIFTDEISKYKFESNFTSIFLYDIDENFSCILNT